MNNIMIIDGQKAVIQYDPEIEMFRGEFLGLSGGADFYASDIDGLKKEGKRSLDVYLEMCKEKGIEPYKSYSGRFNIRMSPELHAEVAIKAAASGKSLNDLVVEAVAEHTRH
ncbi:type II toxin-antitoxin system HicB family antitoxin [Oxalobacter formigenes]|uniref:Toxin-antitoxin system, antitoxin component, HicB family n=1 Tax=Oxalobacter formigenes OXCC13 TaxID=556269 RepID=C3X7W2_OXAFO|nr:type II toxin-antitoxin system HicB family antitoxin [Oxalobacter formigenes]ARQ78757.1 DNA repair protein [Oxalobacter formigenes OXCC13]EEO29288.1 toxin-antitoxin system, antitoxin component, HicB family [Oxalobacter formigenes OXCC13]MCZ4062641.1 type II toxin-antitoxin system HicB family antitoxin [Oxalobacter formigenes]QDX32664.1 type II toxin-antitoxin system HicB family antitoxin [Oxalobacter formigenes]WAW07558.1 type II toxin-antitoxin system HicB family antitoxin [Oxalobacter for